MTECAQISSRGQCQRLVAVRGTTSRLQHCVGASSFYLALLAFESKEMADGQMLKPASLYPLIHFYWMTPNRSDMFRHHVTHSLVCADIWPNKGKTPHDEPVALRHINNPYAMKLSNISESVIVRMQQNYQIQTLLLSTLFSFYFPPVKAHQRQFWKCYFLCWFLHIQ